MATLRGRMRPRTPAAATSCAILCLLAGCSSDGGSRYGGITDPGERQAATVECLEQAGFEPRSVGDTIEVGGPDDPRVEFNISGGESETRAFKGEAQGAMQIGTTLLFVGSAPDAELEKVEECVIG